MEELIVRYAFPGLPVALALYLIQRLSTGDPARLLDVTVFLVVAALVGNTIQQIWMLVFEHSNFGLSYNSSKRRALIKLNDLCDNKVKTTDELYARWETFLYSECISDTIREKDRRTWHFYHTNIANSFGFILGSIVCFAASFLLSPWTFQIIGGCYIVFGILLAKKAQQTRKLVDCLEEYWLDWWYQDIKVSQHRSNRP